MITTFSSQPLGGGYKDSSFRRNTITTVWTEESRPSSIWKEDRLNWWDVLETENSELLLTEYEEFLLVGMSNLSWMYDELIIWWDGLKLENSEFLYAEDKQPLFLEQASTTWS